MDGSQCLIFRELSNNFAYQALAAKKGVICIVGAVRMALLWNQYGVGFLVHDNTNVLFRFYFALNIFISTLFGCAHILDLIRLRFDCFLLDFRYILLTRGVGICAMIAANHLILVLSFERLYSAIFPAHFERNSSKLLSVSIALISIGGSFAYSRMQMSDSFRLFKDLKVALFIVQISENSHNFKLYPDPTPLGEQLFLDVVMIIEYFPLLLTFFIKNCVKRI